ncbi:hypothetical protein OROHE_006370 [Orobanche hederae]
MALCPAPFGSNFVDPESSCLKVSFIVSPRALFCPGTALCEDCCLVGKYRYDAIYYLVPPVLMLRGCAVHGRGRGCNNHDFLFCHQVSFLMVQTASQSAMFSIFIAIAFCSIMLFLYFLPSRRILGFLVQLFVDLRALDFRCPDQREQPQVQIGG